MTTDALTTLQAALNEKTNMLREFVTLEPRASDAGGNQMCALCRVPRDGSPVVGAVTRNGLPHKSTCLLLRTEAALR